TTSSSVDSRRRTPYSQRRSRDQIDCEFFVGRTARGLTGFRARHTAPPELPPISLDKLREAPMSRRILALLLAAAAPCVQAQTVHVRVTRRELVLGGRAFGAAGAYEKLAGKVEFAYDPALAANQKIVDLALAPRNGAGQVEC